MTSAQIDLFSEHAAITNDKPAKKATARDVNAEAKQLLEKTGISAMPREAKEYVLAELISQFFPELKNVMMMSLILGKNNAKPQKVDFDL